MKVKTSVTLSEELLEEIDRNIEGSTNRSLFIERAVRSYLKQKQREQREKSDIEILNVHAQKLNREADEVLSYQVEI
ncbi:MAG: hypothetical protein DRP87_13175 [Spirochaetes bacterium]|nr:MAG: hypothetical protein DRP87_13175 [Spirochaetota bacterium]